METAAGSRKILVAIKRVVIADPDAQSLYEISSFLELKTVWHPIGQ